MPVTGARKSGFMPGVSESANQPPSKIADFEARLAAALAERDAAIAARDEALSEIERLQHLLTSVAAHAVRPPVREA